MIKVLENMISSENSLPGLLMQREKREGERERGKREFDLWYLFLFL